MIKFRVIFTLLSFALYFFTHFVKYFVSYAICLLLLLGPTKVNKVKIFLGPCYMIKRVLTFVSGFQKSVLVDYISQNNVKILHKVETCQNCLHQKFPYQNQQIYIFFIFF